MAKNHSTNKQTDNKGIAKVMQYCSHHQPAIIFRPTPNDDIGIDGEIELIDSDGHPIGDIIKVQLKSTESEGSYIRNETNSEFTFYADIDDMKYWKNVTNEVLLVVYDNRDKSDTLYAKKVKDIDVDNSGRKSIPVRFDKYLDRLLDNSHDFIERFSSRKKPKSDSKRSQVPSSESLISNLIRIQFSSHVFVAPISVRPYSPQFSGEKPAQRQLRRKKFSEKDYNDAVARKLRKKRVFFAIG